MLKNKGGQSPKNETKEASGNLFAGALLNWNKESNNRQMPWKGEKDPYRIWLSEIILQQTRVEQGLKYYENFISTFPDIHALATAPGEKVFKLWEGLGYYSRCSNLIHTAKYISEECGGIFPNEYEKILALKGIGSYTASAIASFAYNLPYAVLDGNVFRVLSRIFGISTPIDSTEGKKEFGVLAQSILPEKKAGEYNQAIMDFGAVICKPVPVCDSCFFNEHCQAFLMKKQDLLPVKSKQQAIRERWFNYIVIIHGNKVLLKQRENKDIWQQLFEFVLIETDGFTDNKTILHRVNKQFQLNGSPSTSWKLDQKLSHQLIHFHFIRVKIEHAMQIPGYFWAKISELDQYALPRTVQQYVSSQLNEQN